ncbi:MAG: sialate O-acetylesterase, partial [Muribaculaceae bacterium]|nr:sialate O-acetylesterase [Muribaculaceae bacterium]
MSFLKRIIFLALSLIISVLSYADKIKVACIGNSVTYGYLLPDREKNAYPFQLQEMLGEDYEVGNFGKSGATLLNKGHRPYTQQQEFKDAMAFGGDITVIHLGLNDT